MVTTRSNSRPRSVKKKEGAADASSGSKQRTASRSPARRRSVSRSRRASRAETEADGTARVTRRRSSRAGVVDTTAGAATDGAADAAEGEQPASPHPPAASAAAAMHRARRASHGDIAAVVRQAPRGYLTPLGLQTLKEYKYQSGFTGATDKYVMIPLWNWCLQFVPLWMAPNLLTTWSLMCGIACYFLHQYHSPDFISTAPSWVFYTTSFLMFFYLILDGLDGKQARRTGSSGPLGQLFDHGCDSICCFMCGIFMCGVLGLGGHKASSIVLLLHILPFYTSNWEEYCTGVMRFGLVGITEGQLLIVGLLAFTGYIGVDAWNTPVDLPDFLAEWAPAVLKPSFQQPMEAKFILVFVGAAGVLYQVASSCSSVYAYNRAHASERTATKVYNKAKRMFAHHLVFLALGMAWVCAPSPFFQEHPRIILLTIGLLFGYQVSRLIISRVTSDPYPFLWLNTLFVPYVALIVNCWTGERLFPTYPVSIAYLCVVTLSYAHFVVLTINQICDFLHIKCFKIVPKLQAQ